MTVALRVLIIEDSENDALLLARQLRKGGYEPYFERVDTIEALQEKLDTCAWDVILSDYSLPQFNGLEALRIVQKSAQDIPFIIVSGAIGEETAVATMKAGAHDYLLKDKLSRLIPVIERELKEAASRHMKRESEAVRRLLEEELKLAKEVAEAANLRKSQVLAFVAHEFKNPLTAISGFAEMLQRGMAGALTEKQLHYVQPILTSSKHLEDLVQDILDISTIEANKSVLKPETVNLRVLLADTERVIAEIARQKQILFSCHVEEGLTTLQAEPKRLRQILINLLSNAIKYTPEHGTVSLRFYRLNGPEDEKNWIIGEVRDNGIGISKENLACLFTEFYRVSDDYTAQQEGLGLGLALTKKLVELHGGSIDIQSKVGVGSTFSFRLPDTH